MKNHFERLRNIKYFVGGLVQTPLGTRTTNRWSQMAAGAGVALAATLLSAVPASMQPLRAIEYSDGTVGFSAPPRLQDAMTTRNRAGESRPTYYLTFTLPTAAEVPLSRLHISLHEGRRDVTFRLRPQQTAAFLGSRQQRGEEVPIATVEQAEAMAMTVEFEVAIAPGQTATLALRPERNPRFSGTYLFEVTGYPEAEQARPSFMGYARLAFYETDRGPIID